MRMVLPLVLGLLIAASPAAAKPRTISSMTAAAKTAAVLEHLRYVVDDLPATAAVYGCERVRRGRRCLYSLTFHDGERWDSAMRLRWRDGFLGWRLVDELPVRWPTDPVRAN